MYHLEEPTCVKMERDYIRAWYIYEKEIEKIKPRFVKLVNECQDDLEG